MWFDIGRIASFSVELKNVSINMTTCHQHRGGYVFWMAILIFKFKSLWNVHIYLTHWLFQFCSSGLCDCSWTKTCPLQLRSSLLQYSLHPLYSLSRSLYSGNPWISTLSLVRIVPSCMPRRDKNGDIFQSRVFKTVMPCRVIVVVVYPGNIGNMPNTPLT